MKIISKFSENRSLRNPEEPIDTLVLHYTGMASAADALNRLCDPLAEVSSHYLVDDDGSIYSLVPEEFKAWHAGVSCWRGSASVNNRSIGIEIQNHGHEGGVPSYPSIQINSVISLCQNILVRRPQILPVNIVGHSDIAPGRKQDPGEHFPWQTLAQHGIGMWPEELNHFPKRNAVILFPSSDDYNEIKRIQHRLSFFGYFIKVDGKYGTKTEDVVRAFKRRFVQHNVSVSWDEHADYALTALERHLHIV